MREGWADSYALRYAIYEKYVTGEWPNANHNMAIRTPGITALPFKHTQRLRNGEWIPDALFAGSPAGRVTAGMYYPNPGCSLDSMGNEIDSHQCGSAIGATYWELAWNVCRLNYAACTAGQAILQSGPYLSVPWALPNSAYAYAADMALSTYTVYNFMQDVNARYWQFLINYSYLDSNSYARVNSTLSHHCVGWNERCSTGHRFPGSPFGSVDSQKVGFTEAELSQNGYAGGVDSSASNGAYLLVPSTVAQSALARFYRDPGNPATLHVFAVVKGSGPRVVELQVDGGTFLPLSNGAAVSALNNLSPTEWRVVDVFSGTIINDIAPDNSVAVCDSLREEDGLERHDRRLAWRGAARRSCGALEQSICVHSG